MDSSPNPSPRPETKATDKEKEKEIKSNEKEKEKEKERAKAKEKESDSEKPATPKEVFPLHLKHIIRIAQCIFMSRKHSRKMWRTSRVLSMLSLAKLAK